MARQAILGAYKDHLQQDWQSLIHSWLELKFFDIILVFDSLKRWLAKTYLQFKLKYEGVSSDILKDILNQQNPSYAFNS